MSIFLTFSQMQMPEYTTCPHRSIIQTLLPGFVYTGSMEAMGLNALCHITRLSIRKRVQEGSKHFLFFLSFFFFWTLTVTKALPRTDKDNHIPNCIISYHISILNNNLKTRYSSRQAPCNGQCSIIQCLALCNSWIYALNETLDCMQQNNLFIVIQNLLSLCDLHHQLKRICFLDYSIAVL